MDFQSMRNWQLAQKRLKEGETHCGRVLKNVGTIVAITAFVIVVISLL